MKPSLATQLCSTLWSLAKILSCAWRNGLDTGGGCWQFCVFLNQWSRHLSTEGCTKEWSCLVFLADNGCSSKWLFVTCEACFFPVTESRGGYVQLSRQLCSIFSLLHTVDDLGCELHGVSLLLCLVLDIVLFLEVSLRNDKALKNSTVFMPWFDQMKGIPMNNAVGLEKGWEATRLCLYKELAWCNPVKCKGSHLTRLSLYRPYLLKLVHILNSLNNPYKMLHI